MKIAFCTHCSDDWFYDGGCSKLLATAKHFHPEIPFYVFGTFELNLLNKIHNNQLNWDILNPIVSFEVAKHYDKVVHFDADSIILGKLDEILDCKTEVFGVRNNNDFDTASKYSDLPVTINNCPPDQYANAGLIGANNKQFWSKWVWENTLKARDYPYKEQDILNLIIQSKEFNFEFLDSKDKKIHYGISAHHGSQTYWDSSKEIYKEKEDFILRGKKIKVYHQAGGHHHFPKLNLKTLFSEDTSKEIEKIIGTKLVTYERLII